MPIYRMNPKEGASFFCGSMILLYGLLLSGYADAEEISEGTILNADNITTYKEKSFDNTKLSALMTPLFERWIVEGGLEVQLNRSQEIILPPKYVKVSQENSGKATIDPHSHNLSDYIAGMPFPHIDLQDPLAGWKMAWNFTKASAVFFDSLEIEARTSMTKVDKGLMRTFEAMTQTILMQGRTSLSPVTLDPLVQKKQILVFTKPNDAAGVGQYFIRYDNGRPDDVWVYVKSVRRVRRVSGGAWMDPTPNIYQLNDDFWGFDAYPPWYPDIKLLGKRKILAVVHASDPNMPHSFESRLNLKGPKFGAPIGVPWEPREVYQIEIHTPKEHLYSKKISYMDTKLPLIYFTEAYDKKNEPWRLSFFLFSSGLKMKDGQIGGVCNYINGGIDFQILETHLVDIVSCHQNNPKLIPDDFTPDALARAAGK